MDWVSFDEIKKTVTLQMAIERYGTPLRRVNATTLRGRCPLPTHHSDKSNESFTATLTKGVGGAWACQSQSCIKARGRVGGNVLDFVAAMEQCSVRDAAIKLQTWFLVPAAGESRGPAGKEPQPEISVGKEPESKAASEKNNGAGESASNKPLAFTLRSINHAHPYLAERGLTEETARKFGVGFFGGKGSMAGRLVIPIHNERGELVAYAGRALDAAEPKYKFPAGFCKSQVLYNRNTILAARTVVVVEGFFDAIKVSQAGFDTVVGLMGCTMSERQHELLMDFERVVLFLDGDEAGRNATKEIANRLMYSHYVRAVSLVQNIQPDALSSEEIARILNPIV